MADKKSREVIGTGMTDHGQYYVEYSDGTREAAISGGELQVRAGEGCGNSACYCTGACRGKADTTPFEYSGGDNEVRIAEDDDKLSDISIRVTADVAEALTGFKALQRELRETTKAVREYEDAIESVDGNFRLGTSSGALSVVIDGKAVGKVVAPDLVDISTKEDEMTYYDLSEVPTKQLHEELAKRAGVTEFVLGGPESYANLTVGEDAHSDIFYGSKDFIEGPARILINKD